VVRVDGPKGCCRGVDEFHPPLHEPGVQSLLGATLLGIGLSLSIAGAVIVTHEPFRSGDDTGLYNIGLGFFGFVIPGVVSIGAGAGLLVMGYPPT